MLNIKLGDQLKAHAKPRYQHDCLGCKYCGQINEYDIYVCSNSDHDVSVIARSSDEGSDYWSSPLSLMLPPYGIAHKLGKPDKPILLVDRWILLIELTNSRAIKLTGEKL
jgi:hypothetical protein